MIGRREEKAVDVERTLSSKKSLSKDTAHLECSIDLKFANVQAGRT